MAKLYSCRPSNLIGLDDPYEAFCFDEACAYIHMEITENKRTPVFASSSTSDSNHYTRASEFYKKIKEG